MENQNSVIVGARDQLAQYYGIGLTELKELLLENATIELVAATDFRQPRAKTIEEAIASKNQHLFSLVTRLHAQVDEAGEVIRKSRTILDILTKASINLENYVTSAESKLGVG